eukprot:gb/GEZN01031891.1/.p1 GENE.gb/GEZN01031891.1/~~gb/GEZN01031891.1/.p1  ORF type:complete len:129 (+),score=24.98 gb/GEZN01031891.1/:44-388(+)
MTVTMLYRDAYSQVVIPCQYATMSIIRPYVARRLQRPEKSISIWIRGMHQRDSDLIDLPALSEAADALNFLIEVRDVLPPPSATTTTTSTPTNTIAVAVATTTTTGTATTNWQQ